MARVVLLAALGWPCGSASAQPANDLCDAALLLDCNTIVQVDTHDATESADDPFFGCHSGGPDRGYATVWFKFVAVAETAHLSACQSPDIFDTLLAVYAPADENAPCASLTEIACSDDAGCPFLPYLSDVCAIGLTPGRTYYVQAAGWTPTDRGQLVLELSCPCPPRPANDDCPAAFAMPCNTSATVNNSTATRSPSDPLLPCVHQQGFLTLWYRFTATDTSALLSTCNSAGALDTVLAVFAVGDPGDPCASLTPLACIDDSGCGFPFGRLSSVCVGGLTPGTEYFVEVATFSEVDRGLVTLDVTCPCVPACVTCPPDAAEEGEPLCHDNYADAYNGGCDGQPPMFQPLACGQRVCGTSGTFPNPYGGVSRDTDWYEFSLAEAAPVHVDVAADFEVQVYILRPVQGCARVEYPASGSAAACRRLILDVCLDAGTYWLWIAPTLFEGVPCGQRYVFSLGCGCSCAGDLNADGAVDGDDIAAFSVCYAAGAVDRCCRCADLSGDGTADEADVSLFVERLLAGGSCP